MKIKSTKNEKIIITTIPPLLLYILCLSRNATYVLHITRELINPSAEYYSTPYLHSFRNFRFFSKIQTRTSSCACEKKKNVVSKSIMYYFAFSFTHFNNTWWLFMSITFTILITATFCSVENMRVCPYRLLLLRFSFATFQKKNAFSKKQRVSKIFRFLKLLLFS